jgi:hypothetical protein
MLEQEMQDQDELISKIEKFGYRYLAINTNSHYDGLRKTFPDLKPSVHNYCIFDYDKGMPLIQIDGEFNSPYKKSKNDIWGKSFKISNKQDVSFLDPYKVDNSYFYQIDKIKPQINKIEQMYGIEHIWLACIYTTGTTRRMIINQQLFGTYQIVGTREFNLVKLLN